MRKDDRYDNGMGTFGALMMGAIIGAAAMFFSDERNRRKVKATMDDWNKKYEDAKDNVQEKAENLREAGLKTVSDELEKTQKRVDRERRASK